MHILISAVSSARFPSGICRHAANLAKSLCNTGGVSRVTLVLGSWQRRYFHAAFGLGKAKLNVVAVNIRNTAYARNLWYYWTLPVIAREHGADIVHLSFPAPVLGRLFPCPVVSSVHDLYPYDAPGNFGVVRFIFNRLFLRQCLRESDAVVCSSDFTLARLRWLAPALAQERATRIYQSVSLDSRQVRQPSLPEVSGRQFLLTVAQHRRNKNLALLLQAIARLQERGEPFNQLFLVLVGAEGPETRTLQHLVQRLSLQEHVLFKSALPDPELCWLYHNCELVIAPSSIEGFGLPVAEALRCGSRVLCSDIPAFREIGDASCRYFDLKQKEPAVALADAIEAILREPVFERQPLDRFSADEIASQHAALYAGLINSRSFATPDDSLSHGDAVPSDRYAS